MSQSRTMRKQCGREAEDKIGFREASSSTNAADSLFIESLYELYDFLTPLCDHSPNL